MPGGHLARQATKADSGSMSFTLVGFGRPRLMKDISMTEPFASGLLDHALRLFKSIQPFKNAYLEYQRGDSSKLQAMQTAWGNLRPVYIEASKAASRDTGRLPTGFVMLGDGASGS